MKQVVISMAILLFCACSIDEEQDDIYFEKIFVENPERMIKVNIFYVENDASLDESSYDVNEQNLMDYLNGYYFHRLGIDLTLHESKSLVNKELYDLNDNLGAEASTFLLETRKSYEEDKINIYIIKKSNITGALGMGRDKRVLLTEESLFSSTSPHEIGHALGLYHTEEKTNIMSTTLDKKARKYFNLEQEEKLEQQIDQINSGL